MAEDADRLLEELIRAQTLVSHLNAALSLASHVCDHLMLRTLEAGKSPAQFITGTGLTCSRVYAILQRTELVD